MHQHRHDSVTVIVSTLLPRAHLPVIVLVLAANVDVAFYDALVAVALLPLASASAGGAGHPRLALKERQRPRFFKGSRPPPF
jgi:hypothetical protein